MVSHLPTKIFPSPFFFLTSPLSFSLLSLSLSGGPPLVSDFGSPLVLIFPTFTQRPLFRGPRRKPISPETGASVSEASQFILSSDSPENGEMKSTASGNSVLQCAGNPSEGEKKSINLELWQACAGPLVNLPAAGTHVVYFPQGHSEQVAASLKKDVDAQIPNYPNLPSKLLCLLHNVTLHADPETDEVYAQMTLQPVPSFDKEALLRSDLSLRAHKPQTEFFCKTLTASDTSTHGGFSVPRRAAEKILPPLDFSMQPPAQELVARDLHDNVWTFRHIFRGQPKRHLLTSGWSLFVNGKRLFAGDSVLFIRDEKQQLLLGLRRANRQPTNLSSSVLSSDSMHIGVLAAAAHAAANNSPFTVFYNPRASSTEFAIPLAKYYKAFYGQQISPGLRFRMMFETEESGTRRYMGTITSVNDLDPVRWKNSQWRNLQVGWDESTAGERRTRVSAWEIEPVTAPFFICPPPLFGQKRPRFPGMPDDDTNLDNLYKRTMPWLRDDPHAPTGLSLMQWMNMLQNPSLGNPMQSSFLNGLPGSTLQSRSLGFTAPQVPQQTSLKFDSPRPVQSLQQLDQFQKSSEGLNPLSSLIQSQQQLCDLSQQPKTPPLSQVQSQALVQNHNSLHHLPSLQNQQQQILGQNQQQVLLQARFPDIANQQAHFTDNQIQLQLLQRLQQQQQSLLSQQQSNHLNQFQEPQRALLDVSQSFSKPLPHTQMLDMPQTQVETISQQITKSNSPRNLQFFQPSQVPKLQQQPGIMPEMQGQAALTANPMSNHLSTAGSSNLTGITDEIPSCSTSPSTNNCPSVANSNLVKELHQKTEVKPSVNIAKVQYRGQFRQSYNDITRQCNPLSNPQSILLGDTGHDVGVPLISDMLTENIPGSNKNFSNNVSSGCMLSNYESTKETQQELSSSMVTQSFGVPDMAFNSIDSAISDNSFMNMGAWAQPPQYQRMRTYTKVYKRGAVGRSIDITRYSGYEELKQDLARMFGVEGQMEDRGRVGWKLVYVDLENDVLLVGDDPWEDFVNCVRCIKILSRGSTDEP